MALLASSSTGASPASPAAAFGRIFGTGEMADLVRAFDWTATSLGPIGGWSESLLTSVNIVLGSGHPIFIMGGTISSSSITTPIARA